MGTNSDVMKMSKGKMAELAQNETTSPTILKAIAERMWYDDEMFVYYVASNPNAPESILKKVILKAGHFSIKGLLLNAKVAEPLLQLLYGKHSKEGHNKDIANHPNCSFKLFKKMYTDNWGIRKELLINYFHLHTILESELATLVEIERDTGKNYYSVNYLYHYKNTPSWLKAVLKTLFGTQLNNREN